MLVARQHLPKAHFNTSLHCALVPRLNLKRARLIQFRGLIDDRFPCSQKSSIFGPGKALLN